MALRLITTQLLHIIYHWNAGVVILRTVVIIPFIRGLFWQENKFTDGPLSLSALARIPVRKTLNYVDLVHCYANRLLLRVCPVSGARLHGPLLFSTLSPLSAGEIWTTSTWSAVTRINRPILISVLYSAHPHGPFLL